MNTKRKYTNIAIAIPTAIAIMAPLAQPASAQTTTPTPTTTTTSTTTEVSSENSENGATSTLTASVTSDSKEDVEVSLLNANKKEIDKKTVEDGKVVFEYDASDKDNLTLYLKVNDEILEATTAKCTAKVPADAADSSSALTGSGASDNAGLGANGASASGSRTSAPVGSNSSNTTSDPGTNNGSDLTVNGDGVKDNNGSTSTKTSEKPKSDLTVSGDGIRDNNTPSTTPRVSAEGTDGSNTPIDENASAQNLVSSFIILEAHSRNEQDAPDFVFDKEGNHIKVTDEMVTEYEKFRDSQKAREAAGVDINDVASPQALGDGGGFLGQLFGGNITQGFEAFKKVIGNIPEFFTKLPQLFPALKESFETIPESIKNKDAMGGAINFIKPLARVLGDDISDLKDLLDAIDPILQMAIPMIPGGGGVALSAYNEFKKALEMVDGALQMGKTFDDLENGDFGDLGEGLDSGENGQPGNVDGEAPAGDSATGDNALGNTTPGGSNISDNNDMNASTEKVDKELTVTVDGAEVKIESVEGASDLDCSVDFASVDKENTPISDTKTSTQTSAPTSSRASQPSATPRPVAATGPQVKTGGNVVEKSFFEKIKDIFA